ncbi:MAG: hypothetical protein U5R06_11975 [candidate division KSB1 bacterium]|nr:hypothetical protein [candidate division KSB1 bacterium]
MNMLRHAKEMNANLLLNTGPLPDGSIYPGDIEPLKTGEKRKAQAGNTKETCHETHLHSFAFTDDCWL